MIDDFQDVKKNVNNAAGGCLIFILFAIIIIIYSIIF
tara:strand:- start:10 stop:120 length:111 start_codon:yes stop_codon:yes gene_type:complete